MDCKIGGFVVIRVNVSSSQGPHIHDCCHGAYHNECVQLVLRFPVGEILSNAIYGAERVSAQALRINL